MYTHIYKLTIKKETINLRNKQEYMGRIGGRKKKEVNDAIIV